MAKIVAIFVIIVSRSFCMIISPILPIDIKGSLNSEAAVQKHLNF